MNICPPLVRQCSMLLWSISCSEGLPKSFQTHSNIETGELFQTQENNSLKTWRNADFKGVKGLTDRDIYVLRTLGAINLPATSYDPRNDSEINIVLMSEIENDQEEDIEAESIN
jgi:hypothetical protein